MIRYSLFAIVFIFLSTVAWAGKVAHDFFYAPMHSLKTPITIMVHPDERLDTLVLRLYQAHLITHPKLFYFLAELKGDRYRLRYGEYHVTPGMTAWQLLHNIVVGTGLVKYRVTFVEGATFSDIRKVLATYPVLKQTLMNRSHWEVMQLLGASDKNPEGWFYPDTYFFTWGNSDISLLKTAHDKMQQILKSAWESRAKDLPYRTPYQALIAASLIERETGIASEKPLIASVIIHRLQKKMRLQIDPTVQYGLKKHFGGEITKKDLTERTRYNTYLVNGLPPTPICMPSVSSINAALHPAKTAYLYYVATGDGTHRFSETYSAHLKAVKKYRHYEAAIQWEKQQLETDLEHELQAATRYFPVFLILNKLII